MAERETVLEVGSSDFEKKVVEQSREVPVLVDFWAPWCGPCRMLGPVLEKIAQERNGDLVLAKVNSDENPDLAARYRVTGIPMVLLFKGGEVVDQFVGALPEPTVREFVRPHCPSEADRLLADGARLLEEGDRDAAREIFERALREDPASETAHLGLARIALAAGDFDGVDEHVRRVTAASDEYEAAQSLAKAIELVREASEIGSTAECKARLAAGEDLEARYALGGHAVAAARYQEALEHFLAVARQDRHWRNEAARKAMLTVFGILGPRHPLSDEYRDKLTSVYF